MGALVMLLMLVIVVAATATVVTLVVMKAINANSRRAYLPPPASRRAGTTADFDQPQPLQPGPQFPSFPAHRLSAADRERIMVLLRDGKKIHAIKLYREATGAGLREAKEAVEHLERYQ